MDHSHLFKEVHSCTAKGALVNIQIRISKAKKVKYREIRSPGQRLTLTIILVILLAKNIALPHEINCSQYNRMNDILG